MLMIFVSAFVILLVMGVPVAFATAGTAFVSGMVMWGLNGLPLDILMQRALSGMNSFTTLAIPLFLLAGKLMNAGTITTRIFNFAQSLVGHLPGGLGHVNVLASVIFSGMSGSAAADAAGLGAIEIKAMRDEGFDNEFSTAVTGISALLSPIIPPSVNMVMYGVLSGTSVAALFMGGILPGLLMAASMSVMVVYYAIKRKYPRCKRATFGEFWVNLKAAALPLLTPVIIIGGIWSGAFTPTESAAVTVLYAFLLIMFVYKALTWRELWGVLREALVDCATILLVMGCVAVYAYVLTRTRLPMMLAGAVISMTDDPILILLLLNAFLLVIGCFMSTTEAIMLFTPIFLPLLKQANINLVMFGVVMCINLMIGQLTPPFGMVLFVLTKISGLSMDRVVRASLPFLFPIIIVLLLCLFFPQIVMLIPDMLAS